MQYESKTKAALIKELKSLQRKVHSLEKGNHKPKEKHAQIVQNGFSWNWLFDKMLEGCMIIGHDWKYLYVNETSAKHGLQKPENLIGKTMLEMYPGVEKSEIFEKYKRCMVDRVPQQFENKFTFQSGITNWYLINVQPVPEGIFVLSLDITKRKLAEESLKKAESGLNEAQRMAHIGNWELDLEKNILTWSDEIYRIFEIDRQKFGASYEAFLDAIHPEDRDSVNTAYTYSIKNKTSYSIDHRLLFSKGRIKFVHEECQTFYNEKGKPVRSVGTVQDITERKTYEHALLTVSLYTRGLIEASLDPLVTISEDGKITDVNHATETVTGLAREQLIGKDFSDFFTEPDKARNGYQKVLSDGIVRDYPLQIKHISGKVTNVLYNATVYKNQKGVVQGIFAAARDITERISAEKLIRLKNEYNRRLIESSLDPLVTIGPNGKITDVNKASESITGVPREKLIGTDFSDYFTEPEKAKAGYKEVFEKGFVRDYPLEIRHKDGKVFSVLYNASLYTDENDNIVGIFAAARDVTELKKADELIRQKSEYNRRLIEASLDPLVTIGPEGKITDVNKATETITGFQREELIGTDFSEYFTEPEKAKAGYQEVFEKGFVRDYPLEIRSKDGQVFSVLYNASVYRDEYGKVVGVFAAARDITGRKRAEDALQASEEKFLKAFRLSPIALTLADIDDGILVEANDAFEQITGYTAAEVLGRTAHDIELFPAPYERERFTEMLRTTGQVRSAELCLRHKSGTLHTVRCFAEVIAISGKQYILTAAEDITEHKLNEQTIVGLNRVYKVLSETNQLIVREKDRKHLLEELCRIAVEEGNLLMASVSFVDYETRKVTPFVWYGKEEGYFSTITFSIDDVTEGRGPTGTAIRENRYVFSTDIASEPEMLPWREEALKRGYRSSASFPLVQNEKVIGAFTVYAGETDFFNEHELTLFDELTMDVSYALQNLEIENSRKQVLEAMVDSEEKFRKLASSAKDSIIIIDDKGKFFYWNESFEKLFGYTSGEIEGKEIHKLIAPTRLYDISTEGFTKYQQTGEGVVIDKTKELVAVKKNGSEFPIELSVSELMFKGKRMSIGILRDITERKQAEDEIVKSSRLLEALFTNHMTCFVILDKDFNFIRVNEAYARACARNVSDFPGHNHFEFYPSDAKAIFEEVVSSKKSFQVAARPFVFEDHPEWGATYWDWSLVPILDRNGDVEFLVFSLNDVTERVIAEQELKTSNDQLRQVFDNIDAVVFSLDIEHWKLLKISNACEKVYGFKQEKFFENPRIWMTLIHPEDLPAVQANWQSLVTHKKDASEVEYRIIRHDGETRWIRNETKSITDENGKAIRLDGISYDITEQKLAKEAVHKSEDRYRDLVENSTDLICTHDLKGRILTANLAASRLLGYDIKILLNMSIQDIIAPEFKHEFQSYLSKISTKGTASGILIVQTKSGEKRIWQYNNTLRTEGVDQPIVRGMAQDITERRKAEGALALSEANYKHLFENNPHPMWVYDLETLRFLAVNDTAVRKYGYSREEFLSMTLLDIRPDEEKEKLIKNVEISNEELQESRPWKHKLKDGTIIFVDIISHAMKFSERKARLVIAHDITDELKSEEALRESELRFRSITTSAHDAIITVNQDGLIQDWNWGAHIIFGYKENEIIGKPLTIIIPLNNRVQYFENMDGFASHDENSIAGKTIELPGLHKNGNAFPIELSVAEWKTSKGRFYTGIIRDITEKKNFEQELIRAKEKAEASNKLKTEFLQQMSHEIRSPMNVAISLSNLIKDEVCDKVAPEILEYFEGIDLAGKRLIRTVDLILNTSEMYVGTYEPTYAEMDIFEETLKHLKSEFGTFAKRKGLEFLLTCNIGKPHVTCDRYSVNQIFGNLIDNAIKYTHQGRVEITVDKNSDEKVTVSITDTGIGISEEFMGKLFEPFTQEERGYSRRYEGNGLGLALVKKYCDLNNITIAVESQKGKGSKFTLTFLNSR